MAKGNCGSHLQLHLDAARCAWPDQASEDALALLAQMVALDPGRRISASSALSHRYFRAEPPPTPPEQLPKPPVRARNPLALGPKVHLLLRYIASMQGCM